MSFYQTGSINFDYNGTNYTIPCNNPDLVPIPIPQVCEAPQVSNGATGCAFACPLPSLSDSQYDNVKIMQGILGWFSWVNIFSLVLSSLIFFGFKSTGRYRIFGGIFERLPSRQSVSTKSNYHDSLRSKYCGTFPSRIHSPR